MKKIDNTLMRTLALIDLRIPFVINPVLQEANKRAVSLMSLNDWDIQMTQVKGEIG